MTHFDPQQLAERLDAHVAAEAALAHLGGIGIYVAQGGKPIYKKYHGCKSYTTGEPLSESGDTTVFRLASMSKPITAVAALIQVSRGLLDLDEPVDKYLPAFAEMNIGKLEEDGSFSFVKKATTKITSRILLNHTNGVGTYELGERQISAMSAEDMQDLRHVVDYISRSYLSFNPGDEQMYSGVWAFDVMARVIEETSGVDFATFLKQNIFDPCGMIDTTFDPTPDQWSRFIAVHGCSEQDGTPVSVDIPMRPDTVFAHIPPSWPSGGAGLASTLPDYVRFVDMLARGGVTADGVRILPEELVRAMATPTVSEAIMPGGERWGLGVRCITPAHPWMPAGCFGWSGAYGTHFWIDPENDLYFVLMRNSMFEGGAGTEAVCKLERVVYNK